MISVVGGRGTGKTTKLFELAKEKNAIILCPNSRALRQKAKALGYKDLEIIGFGDLDNDNFSLGKQVLVDESSHVLQTLLNKFYLVNMIGFSATVEEDNK